MLSLLALAPTPLKAKDGIGGIASQATLAVPEAQEPAGPKPTLSELRAQLDGSDRTIALQALELALNELGDGTTLVWKRAARQLAGSVRPVSAFRDDSGRVCRHVIYVLTLGSYTKQVEGIACRDGDGRWALQG